MKKLPFLQIIIFFIISISTGVFTGFIIFYMPEFYEVSKLETYSPPVVTKILSSDGEIISDIFFEKRHNLDIHSFSPHLINALIATEDRVFFQHTGISPKGILRALIADIKARAFVQGASTLTQQLTKTLFLSSEKKLTRKIKEMFIAFQIEKKYTKKEILALYLNQIYLGGGAYGAESAANTYFGKSASELSMEEAALIAGMPKAPSYLSPLNNIKRAKKRRDQVLKNMLVMKYISEKEYKKAISKPVILTKNRKRKDTAPWFTSVIKNKLEKKLGYDLLYKKGLNIHTSMDMKIQRAAKEAVDKFMPMLDKRMASKKLKSKAECAVVVMDIKKAEVIALVGGRDFTKSQFNRAITAKRQPGSAFKPLVYALAIKNSFQENYTLLDTPAIFNLSRTREWRPQNFSHTFSGEMTMRKALAKSKNIPAVRMIEILKPSNVADFAKKLGIKSRLSTNLSLALGTSEMNLLELTSAYSVFPRGGVFKKPIFIKNVLSSDASGIFSPEKVSTRVIDKKTAAITVDLLTSVFKEGTGKKGNIEGYPLAGKTGTTDNYHDALFIGFSPSVAIGVWVGCDDNSTLGRYETGAKAALPIWNYIMKKIIEERSYPEYFPIPDGLEFRRFDSDSGKFMDENSEKGVTGLFLKS